MQTQTTITEALQEIKTINSRLDKKRVALGSYLARDSRLRDPLEKSGGSASFIKTERQSITDLEKRIVSIRTAIQRSNLTTAATVNSQTMTVAEWLTWRREVSTGSRNFLSALGKAVEDVRKRVQQQGGKVVANIAAVTESTPNAPPEIVVNVDEKLLLEEQEGFGETVGGFGRQTVPPQRHHHHRSLVQSCFRQRRGTR